MLQEGSQAQAEGVDVVIGYLEPHDRPETAGARRGARGRPAAPREHGALELEEMDVDAVIRRAPELALIDELAHTNAPGSRNAKRYEDIEEVLDAGIDVISTVNVQHLESLNDAIFELTGVRVRETFPDRILDEADEVVLVDLSPEALQERLRAGKVYPLARVDAALVELLPRREPRRAARARAARGRRGRRGAARRDRARPAQPAGGRASGPRARPAAAAARSASCAAPGARRSGSAPRWTRSGCGSPATRSTEERSDAARGAAAAGTLLGAHFLEEEGDDLVDAVQAVVADRGSTYVFVGTPDESRRREILRGSLVSRIVRELPGIDIRVVADRARAEEVGPVIALLVVGSRRSSPPSPPPSSPTADSEGRSLARRRRFCPVHERRARPRRARSRDPDRACRGRRARAAYLVVVPLKFAPEAPCSSRSRVAMPLLEAVEHAALRAGVAVDARIERGRTPVHALSRLWEVERFDRVLAPAPLGHGPGFTPKELMWILEHAPSETLILKPDGNGLLEHAQSAA